jgi:hypothetical protein
MRLRTVPEHSICGSLATWCRPRGSEYLLPFLVLLVTGFAQIIWGETLPVNNGLGWDGRRYANVTAAFSDHVFGGQLNSYELQRILPSAVLSLALNLLGMQKTDGNIVRGFQIYNLMLLLVCSLLWSRLASILGLSQRSRWIGFVLLFFNVPNLKMSFYYPVVTDTTAFAFGFGLAYCFFTHSRVSILLLAAMGSFVWPTLLYSAILLYVVPNARLNRYAPERARYKLNTIVAAMLGVGLLLSVIYVHYVRGFQPPNKAASIDESLLLLSLAIAVTYLSFSLKRLLDLDDLFRLDAILAFIRPLRLILAGFVVLGLKAIVFMLDNGEGGYTAAKFLANAALSSVAKPGIFLLAHLVYFGPAVVVVLCRFESLCRIVHQCGLGLTLYFAAHIILALSSESRQMIAFFPVVVVCSVLLLEKMNLSIGKVWMICAACLLLSKVWLPVNRQPLTGEYLAFPFQYYFMNHGPWMSYPSYLSQGILLLLVGSLMYMMIFRGKPPTCEGFAAGGHPQPPASPARTRPRPGSPGGR